MTSEPGEFDSIAFRQALGRFAAGVAIVTARMRSNRPVGVTICSFNSVSLQPPLILFSINRKANSLNDLLEAKGFAVNILSCKQQWMADQFAQSQADKWKGVEHVPGHAGAPLLTGALAHFECTLHAQHDGGDHVIFVGRVERFSTGAADDPLIYFRGAYRTLAGAEDSRGRPPPIEY